jgi:hypothetical protein
LMGSVSLVSVYVKLTGNRIGLGRQGPNCESISHLPHLLILVVLRVGPIQVGGPKTAACEPDPSPVTHPPMRWELSEISQLWMPT